MAQDLQNPDPAYLAFWQERHVCTLTTMRPDGTPHVVPVGVTFDPEQGLARVITSKGTTKARNVLSRGDGGARVAVCQMQGRRWATLEGLATVRTDEADVRDAEARYAVRYERQPRPNPERVVIEIRVTKMLGRV
ncbi:PPOX class F420-dependent oxidoreductase [Streptomyces sclerotialus]|uniref:PPOX class F420-dependent oxidoreductase n=1 Tax=Streptomyces sclerotialus TaxID=1957 RepID=UPI0004CB2E6E